MLLLVHDFNLGGVSMQNSDYKWFVDNCKKLFQEFGPVYLVIKNKTVLGSYESYAAGVRAALLCEAPGTFIVQKCGSDESAYTNYISSMFFSA